MPLHTRFDRGTLCIEGAGAADLPGVLWDARTHVFRAPAYRALAICAGHDGAPVPWPTTSVTGRWKEYALRDYQARAVDAWDAFEQRGVVVLPTGSGKTRVAIAAMARTSVPAVVLCPTRALLEQWAKVLADAYDGPIGVVGDGHDSVEDVTVMTFESAYRHMDRLGARFALLVVDEAHHFGGGARAEALEMITAPRRLGLTATAPFPESPAAASIERLIGPKVCEVTLGELVGGVLAGLDVVRLSVALTAQEAATYARAYAPFAELRGAFARTHPAADWSALVSALGQSAAGRAALRGFQRASALASFPEGKRRAITRLLAQNRDDKTLVFTAMAEDAYRVGRDNLVPVISAETSSRERKQILDGFRDGTLRTLASARVLNEGLDVPDARVAILAGSALGEREALQRVGRVLRPSPGKRALVYELITAATLDSRRAETRRHRLAPHCAALG